MNLFYCSGMISIIIASSLIKKKKFKNQKNFLIIEQEKTINLPKNATSVNNHHHKLAKIITKGSNWENISTIKTKYLFVSLDDYSWFSKLIPLKKLRFILKKKKTVKNLNYLFDKIRRKYSLIVSDNSSLWRYIYDHPDAIYLEHGAASYRKKPKINKNWKFYLKKILSKFNGINLDYVPNSIFLSDGKMSNLTKDHKNNINKYQINSINLKKEIKEVFDYFIQNFKLEYPKAFLELLNIKKKYGSFYIYLPTSMVEEGSYSEYLKKQILQNKKIKKQNIFLIKPHSNDSKRDYSKFFKELKINSIQFEEDVNKFIPSEILLYFFEKSIIIGSYSSTHLYSNWWLNRKTIFTEVKDFLIEKRNRQEYKSTLNDFKLLKS
jgi:hypothetical protein